MGGCLILPTFGENVHELPKNERNKTQTCQFNEMTDHE